MLKRIRLERFKNFEDAELVLGPLTLLIGTNASGKSNIRDAFRFLHGISRGYTLAEIMGEKYGEGGVLQWQGIRGGVREITYFRTQTFALTIEFESKTSKKTLRYAIEVEPGLVVMNTPYPSVVKPRVVKESLYHGNDMMFDSHPPKNSPSQEIREKIVVQIQGGEGTFSSEQPALSQMMSQLSGRQNLDSLKRLRSAIEETLTVLRSMRFLDLDPEAMRRSSFPGQVTLGDQGENLSSVLQAIWEDSRQKKTFIEWIRELTPMDAQDFEFFVDQSGKISLTLVESNSQKISIHSASDGTLQLLGLMAALLGPKAEQLYVFDEIDNGLHPARLHLLLQLLEWKAFKEGIQIIGTTHSPQVLNLLSREAREFASLVYRLPETPQGQIKRVMEISDIDRVLETQDLARLHESGWFEDVMDFDAEVAG